MKTILVPLDGSPLSERALPLACALAHRLELKVRLLYVREPESAAEHEHCAQTSFQAAQWHVRQQYGLEPITETRSGYPAHVIVEETRGDEVWAIAMASHSREALLRSVLGSVAEQVVDLSSVPVFLVPSSVDAPGLPDFRRILVPLDGSERAEATLKPVRQLARDVVAEVIVLRVFQPVAEKDRATPDMLALVGQLTDGVTPEELAAVPRYERRRPKTVEKIVPGDPTREIIDICERERVDLVAFATYGRTALDHDRLSRVAEAVLRHSRVPLMVFGREALRRLTDASPRQAPNVRMPLHKAARPRANQPRFGHR